MLHRILTIAALAAVVVSTACSDRTPVNPAGDAALTSSATPEKPEKLAFDAVYTADELFRGLQGEDAIVIAHVGGRYADLKYAHDGRLERAVEVRRSDQAFGAGETRTGVIDGDAAVQGRTVLESEHEIRFCVVRALRQPAGSKNAGKIVDQQ